MANISALPPEITALHEEINAIHCANMDFWQVDGRAARDATFEYYLRQDRLEEIRYALSIASDRNSMQLGPQGKVHTQDKAAEVPCPASAWPVFPSPAS